MNCSPLGSSIHGILQARILERVTIPFLRGSSQPRDQNQISSIAGRFFTVWATREEWSQYIIWIYLPSQIWSFCYIPFLGKWQHHLPVTQARNSRIPPWFPSVTAPTQSTGPNPPKSAVSPTPPPLYHHSHSAATGDRLELPPEADTTGCNMFWQPQRMVWCFQAAFSFYFLLAAPALSCGTCDLLVAARKILRCNMQDLVPWPGIEPGPPALGAWSLSPWTTKEVPLPSSFWTLYFHLFWDIYFTSGENLLLYSSVHTLPFDH